MAVLAYDDVNSAASLACSLTFVEVTTPFMVVEEVDFRIRNRIPRLIPSNPVLSADSIVIRILDTRKILVGSVSERWFKISTYIQVLLTD